MIEWLEIHWAAVLIGAVVGLVVGLILNHYYPDPLGIWGNK